MLSAMAPHGREMSQDLRKKIISLHKKGEGYKKISKALLISQTFKDGTATISQRRPGRPRKLTPHQERLLMRRVEENRHASSLQLSKEVESQTGVTISRDTIRRTLQRNGPPRVWISEEEQGERDSVAKYVSWSEPNRTPYGEFWRDKLSITLHQHPISKRGHSWRTEKDRSGKMSPTCSFHA